MQIFNDNINKLMTELNLRYKQFAEYISVINEPNDPELARLKWLNKKLEVYIKNIQWNNSFIDLAKTFKLECGIVSLREKNLENEFKKLKELLKEIQVLWETVINWNSIEREAQSKCFTILNYKKVKRESEIIFDILNDLNTSIDQLLYANTNKVKENPIDNMIIKVNHFLKLIDETECLQSMKLLPQKGIIEIIKLLKINSMKFSIFQIDLEILNYERRNIINIYKKYHETFRFLSEFNAVKIETEAIKLSLEKIIENCSSYFMINYEGVFDLIDANLIALEVIDQKITEIEVNDEIKKLREDLENMNCVIELLVTTQNKQLQINRFFQSSRAKKVLGELEKELDQGESIFENIMNNIKENPNLYQLLENKQLLEDTKKLGDSFKTILISLENIFDHKRMNAPRLLFLSNEQLIELLEGISTYNFPNISLIFPGILKPIIETEGNPSSLPPICVYKDSKTKSNDVLRLLYEGKTRMLYSMDSKSAQCQISGFIGFQNEIIHFPQPIVLENIKENIEWIVKLEGTTY